MALTVSNRAGQGLAAEVKRRPPGAAYLECAGHANLDSALLVALKPLMRVVLIHDTIPLDHPGIARQGRPGTRFMAAMNFADLIATVSQATAEDAARWRGRLAITTARRSSPRAHRHHAVAPDAPTPLICHWTGPSSSRSARSSRARTYALLLDAWDDLARRLPAAQMPRLLILGRRGWENHAVFARPDKLPKDARAERWPVGRRGCCADPV